MKQAYIVGVEVSGMDQALDLGTALREVVKLCDPDGKVVRCKDDNEVRVFSARVWEKAAK